MVPKHRNEFDADFFDFVLMLIYLCDVPCFGFSVATSVVDQPFVVAVVPKLGHLLPSKWMNVSVFEFEKWAWFEPYVFVYCANILMNLNQIHFSSLMALNDTAQDWMQTMAVDCVGYGYESVVCLAMVDLLSRHSLAPSKLVAVIVDVDVDVALPEELVVAVEFACIDID